MGRVPWIENISIFSAKNGLHYFEDHKTILIQIQESGTSEFVHCLYNDKFVNVYRFDFDDSETGDDRCITESQAENIAEILLDAFDKGLNIVVHCHAGVCRSGAVAEVGEMIGFQYAGNHKSPNLLVKKMILKYVRKKVGYESDNQSPSKEATQSFGCP